MNTKEFFIALDLIEKEKGISRTVVIEAFEHALVSAYKRNFNEAANIVVKIDEISEFQGDLISFESDILVLECLFKTRKKKVEIDYSNIKKARLAVKF